MHTDRNDKNGGDGDLTSRVSDWLRTIGLPLELETHAAFIAGGFGSQHSAVYIDPESMKAREIDVVAWMVGADARAYVQFNIECKSSPKPWIVVRSKLEAENTVNFGTVGFVSEAMKESGKLASLLVGREALQLRNGGYLLKQAFSGETDPGYNAAIAASKSAQSVLTENPELNVDYVSVQPVIVVDSVLFECEVQPDGTFRLEETDTSAFRFRTVGPNGHAVTIRVATKRGLPLLVQQCREMAMAVFKHFPPDDEGDV